ncbi:MAG: response regulator transcription factor [Chlorobium sp.]|jgi:two-component system phosphate regulon response regulator PhoB|uniref:response regulator transcription factor n=1 Tax=Chlorobium sp. TaxID=1095 RepID=UPI001DF80392|nr:response regulator transcription factor [Chlorobium sp.]MBN1279346.1 response regulator transcription factor [Chlorobiaceae bacterium]MCF8217016.1 response regulator transcription factor [Chlorobium sp.]MCF8271846.1 response regulator transcription factor [Chlorobium sp.]MCF8288233.1 response regulator transcription factor [Chlorobium sp.]MCF8291818.1 response regulator transcription factor [Chlorobium sp.]
MSEPLLLVVEDDDNLAKLLSYNLERAGYRCHVSRTGEDGLEQMGRRSFDLLLLDIMLPGIDGFEVCRRVREHQMLKDLPIIMLTAKGEEIDKILGFELGIDDYVVKPFSPRELNLRIRAVLKRDRRQRSGLQDVLSAGGLEVDISRHQVTLDGKTILLTLMEFKLLVALLKRRGQAQSRDLLLSDVWDVDKTINTRTIDTHVTRLREKLGDTGKMIKTVRGLGYKFEEPDGEQ